MPVPKPRKKEDQNKFISRCMADPTMNKEYDQKQRAAICYSSWKNKSKACDNTDDTDYWDENDPNNPTFDITQASLKNLAKSSIQQLNHTALAHAHSLIASGKVDGFDKWDFNWANDASKLIKHGGLDKWCLGHSGQHSDPTKQSDWSFPISKDGVDINYHGCIAAKQRAAAQHYTEIEKAADSLITAIHNKYPDKFK